MFKCIFWNSPQFLLMIFIDIYSSISERKAKGVCQRLSIICKGDQTFTGLCCESTIYLLFDLDEPSRLLFWTIRNSHISVDFARLKSHSRNDMIIRWWFRIDCQANFLHGISHHRLRFSESNLSRCEIAVCHDGKQKNIFFSVGCHWVCWKFLKQKHLPI